MTDAQADRSPIVYIDMESFKGHSYPDVLVSVLLSTFNEFGKWIDGVAVEPGSKQSFWKKLIGSLPNRGPIKDGRLAGVKERLVKTVRELDALLHSPDESDRKESRTASKGKLTNTKGGGKVSVPNLELDFNESAERRYEQTGATEDTYKRK
ncbi:hypothetical protein ACFSX5_07965 [Devosia albogilva]|uniref:Uncharacterized protein n=1 Tax=Devosia albogilva TaxID=429726 RepID=A0ABW5QJM4_9HYPH